MRLFKENGVGRITKQNQTKDVGPNQVSKEAAKFGNKVDKDGRPPVLSKKVSGPKSNIAANLGLAESMWSRAVQKIISPRPIIKKLEDAGIKLSLKQEAEIIRLDKEIKNIDRHIKLLSGDGISAIDPEDLKQIKELQTQKREANTKLMEIIKGAMQKGDKLAPDAKDVIIPESLVINSSSVRSYIISMIAEKIAQTDDIDQLAEWLKIIVGKDLEPRGKMRYTISEDDIKEAILEADIIRLNRVCKPEKQQRIKEFALYCLEQLGITKAPRIKLTDDSGTTALGFTNTEDKSITVTVKDRHQMDIMRTLAHELVHYKQLETYMPDGATGSDDENEANALAGVLLRNWGKQNPNLFYESLQEEWNGKKVLSEKKPCWKGYKQIGMKKKGKKEVPNCVPVKEGWGADEITPYSNGYTLWHRKQSLEKGMLPYWLYKTPEEFSDWKDSMKWDLEKTIKSSTPIAKLATIQSVIDLMNIEKDGKEIDEGFLDSLFGDDEPEVNEHGYPYYTGDMDVDMPVVLAIYKRLGEFKALQYLTKKLKYPDVKAALFLTQVQMEPWRSKYKPYKPKKPLKLKETATAGATSSGNIASVANPVAAHAKVKRDKNGVPKAPQKKNKNGTAKNALDMSNNLMAEKVIKR